jgi:hypothetical protein
MNILVLTNQLPWPPSAGGQASQFAALKALEIDHQFRIILTDYQTFREEDAQALESSLVSTTVVRANKSSLSSQGISPLPFSTRAKTLLKRTYKKILARSKQDPANNNENPVKTSFERAYFPFNRLSFEILEYISRNLAWADLIQAEFHEALFAGLLPIQVKPKLFVCHQAHGTYTRSFYDSRADSEAIRDDLKKLVEEADVKAAYQLETCLMNNFDHVIVFSEEDKSSLALVASEKVTVSPFPLPADIKWKDPLKVDFSLQRIAFLGPGFWHPNVEALEWLIHQALPALMRIRPDIPLKLYVAGKWSPQQVAKFESNIVIFEGFVDDLSAFLQGSITVNPIFVGAGLRTKLLAAAASASPIVSSSLGADGTGFVHGQHCMIADSPVDFATSIASLYENQLVAQELAVAAYTHVQTCFSQEAVRKQRNLVYSKLAKAAS